MKDDMEAHLLNDATQLLKQNRSKYGTSKKIINCWWTNIYGKNFIPLHNAKTISSNIYSIIIMLENMPLKS